MSGELKALKVMYKIYSKLKLFYWKNRFLNFSIFEFLNFQIFEFAQHYRIDTRQIFQNLKSLFARQTWGKKQFHLLVLLHGTVYLN